MTCRLASGRKPADVRVGHAQILVGIHRDIVDADFVVEVRTGAASAVADVADGVTAVNMLSGEYCETLQVSVAGCDSVTVVDHDGATIPAHEIGEFNYALGWSNDRLPEDRTNVNSGMEGAFSVERINTFAE